MLLTKETTPPKSHLIIQEKEALKELVNREDLSFNKAGKGGATVEQDIDNYRHVCSYPGSTRQLEGTNFYKTFTINPNL